MSLKNSQTIEDLKHEYIYGSVLEDGRRSFKSLDNLIKEFELSPSTIYRRSSKEQWKDQRIAFRAELSEEIKKAKKALYIKQKMTPWACFINLHHQLKIS